MLGATWFRWLSQSEVRVDGDSGMPRGIPSHQLLSLFIINPGKLPLLENHDWKYSKSGNAQLHRCTILILPAIMELLDGTFGPWL